MPQSLLNYQPPSDSQPVIVAACRTPVGRAYGALASLPMEALLAPLFTHLLAALPDNFSAIDEVIIGNATGGGGNIARLAALMLMAALVTLTTRTSEMIDALEKGLFWLRFLRINPAKVSLALSLALRFIPVLAGITAEVREAQKARGLDRSVLAVAIPVIVRTLKMADDIAAALEARAWDPQLRRERSDAEKVRE